MKLGYWLAAIASMFLATSASAYSVTYTETLSPVSADVHTSLSAPLFGIAFKSLTSVVITLEYDIQAGAIGAKVGGGTHSGTIINGSNNATTASLSLLSKLTESSAANDPAALTRALSIDTPLTLASTANVSIARRNQVYFDSIDASHILALQSTETLLSTSSTSDLTGFLGQGDFTVNLDSKTTLALTGKGLLNQDVGVAVGAILKVTYNYSDMALPGAPPGSPKFFSPPQNPLGAPGGGGHVPEPSTGLLAVAALAFAGRHRKGR